MGFRGSMVRDSLNTWHTPPVYVHHLTTFAGYGKGGRVQDRVRDTGAKDPPKLTGNRTESVTGEGASGRAGRSRSFLKPHRLSHIQGYKPDITRRG